VGSNVELDKNTKTIIIVDNPSLGFAQTLEMFDKRKPTFEGIHKSAVIGTNVKLGKNLTILPNAVIEDNVELGDNSFIGAGVYIGNGSTIGYNSKINSNVTIYDFTIIGNHVTIDSGTVIGADGFGWVTDKGKHHKIPQIGRVVLGDYVWIGANCCIDRGTFKDTKIGKYSKLDNQIHIAHNVQIGESCLFAAMVGIAGSTIIGNYVTLAGQVGVVGHITIGDRVIVASKSAVMQSVQSGKFISGIPAQDHRLWLKQEIASKKIPDMMKRLREIENKLDNN
jgi:UDP-3-O-[3-hydroxymyristoyl] glucosamine N-acyltransferase